ncbi:MAG: lipopolysaccharide biosynthesis protein [Paludibacteraceae bacterium]|nr:lipopolysaccharide biosynthesis protein [Paludibacteraceae bacterium]
MYVRMIVTVLIGLYSSRIILQTLGVDDYGIYNVVGGVVVLFAFLNNALSQATQRFIAYYLGRNEKEELQRTFSMCLNVHLLIAILIVLLAETVGLWLVYNKLVISEERFPTALWVYQFSVISSFITVTQVPYNAAVRAHERFDFYAYVSIGDAVLRLLIIIGLAYQPYDSLYMYGLLILCVIFIQSMVYRVYCRQSFSECKYIYCWEKSRFLKIFSYTSWSLLGNIADTLSEQGVNILLNMFFGPAVNAARGIAVHVKSAVAGFVYNFQSASNPQIVKQYAVGEFDAMVNLVIKTSKISFFLFLFVMFPLCIELRQILSLWLGNVPDYIYEFSLLTLFTVLIQSVGGTLQTSIQASGNIRLFQILVGGSKLMVVPISYILLKLFSFPVIPFVVILVVYGGVVIVNLYIVKKIMNFPILRYIKEVIFVEVKVFALSVILPIVLVLNVQESLIRAIFSIPLTLLSIGFVSYYFGFNKNEQTWLLNFLFSKFRK